MAELGTDVPGAEETGGSDFGVLPPPPQPASIVSPATPDTRAGKALDRADPANTRKG